MKRKKKEEVKPLYFLGGFESSEPDAFHQLDYSYCEPYIREKRVLNVGCWTGNFEKIVNNNSSHCQIMGIDPNLQALRLAKQNNSKSHFIQGDIQRSPFVKNSFDVVTLLAVLEHLPEKSESNALQQIHNTLKEGGRLILTTPNSQWLGNILDVPHWLTGHRHYKIKVLEQMLQEEGFEIERAELRGRTISEFANFLFYPFKYFLRINLFKLKITEKLFKRDYEGPGFRMIYIIARKKSVTQ